MKKIQLIITSILLFVFVVIQFFPINRNNSTMIYSTDFISVLHPPEKIADMIRTSCYDCHSNHTEYPWYSYIQPFGWVLERHIQNGKGQLNFSEFGQYSVRMQKNKLKSMVNQIEDNKMPLSSYAYLHKSAKINHDDRNALYVYIDSLLSSL